MFWKTVKSFFSDESNNFENVYILLISTSCLLMILKLRKPINKYFQNLESFEKRSVQVLWTSNLFFFLLQNIGFARWPEIILSQTLIYYWQEIFLLALTSDSEVILKWYHCIVFRLNRTMKCIVNLNMTCLVLFLFWFRLFMCTVWLLFYSLFTFSSCSNKTGWLQNEY